MSGEGFSITGEEGGVSGVKRSRGMGVEVVVRDGMMVLVLFVLFVLGWFGFVDRRDFFVGWMVVVSGGYA